GNFAAISLVSSRSRARALLVHVRGSGEIRLEGRYFRSIRTRSVADFGRVWIRDDISRNYTGVLSGATDHVAARVRGLDDRRDGIFHRARRVFLFCLWHAGRFVLEFFLVGWPCWVFRE